AAAAQEEIETFLETHFYNYEEFETDPANFKLRFDTIAGDNASKTPLIEQVDTIKVKDLVETNVTNTLYYLNVQQGGDEGPYMSDYIINTCDGRLMILDLFDSSVIPVRFNLVDKKASAGIIRGLQRRII